MVSLWLAGSERKKPLFTIFPPTKKGEEEARQQSRFPPSFPPSSVIIRNFTANGVSPAAEAKRRRREEFRGKGAKGGERCTDDFWGPQDFVKSAVKKEAGTQKQKMLYATHRENESFVSKILRNRTMLSSRNQTWNCGGGGHGGGRRPRRERKQGKGEIRENARNARGEYCSRSSVMSLLSLPPPFSSLSFVPKADAAFAAKGSIVSLLQTHPFIVQFSQKKPLRLSHVIHSVHTCRVCVFSLSICLCSIPVLPDRRRQTVHYCVVRAFPAKPSPISRTTIISPHCC